MAAEMNNRSVRIAAAGMAAAFAATGAMAASAFGLADACGGDVAQDGVAPAFMQADDARAAVDSVRSIDEVRGAFSFTQTEVTSNERISKAMGDAQKYLCGSDYTPAVAGEYAAWSFAVGGDVRNAFCAPLAALAEDGATTIVMGCSCAGNPADGASSINAGVTGVTIASLLEAAAPLEGVNTVVFTSADGYEVALPLSYVAQRHSLIVFEVNGAPISDSVGGANQLWLGSTSARYFARDIVSISFEARDAVPAAPGSRGSVVPNVSIDASAA